ncbi:MAG: hypothetical protein K8I30_11480, partial [Anaerolineae bacterium]|nr:hypothetical protein [Anaerolineae bacterium]
LPVFTWEPSPDATRYEFKLTASNPSSVWQASGSAARYLPAQPLLIGAYSWQVRAVDAAGNWSAWTAAAQFTVASPENAVPALNYYTTNTVKLTWSPVVWAVRYEIEVDSQPRFANPLEYEATTNQLQVTTPALGRGTHYWRVRAQTRSGAWGAWSPVQSFQVAVSP